MCVCDSIFTSHTPSSHFVLIFSTAVCIEAKTSKMTKFAPFTLLNKPLQTKRTFIINQRCLTQAVQSPPLVGQQTHNTFLNWVKVTTNTWPTFRYRRNAPGLISQRTRVRSSAGLGDDSWLRLLSHFGWTWKVLFSTIAIFPAIQMATVRIPRKPVGPLGLI